jgi:precorrin-3B C17-methyltransferase
MTGHLAVVSLGPGSLDQLTPAARAAIAQSDVILGYRTYLDLIAGLAPAIPREASGMRHEVQRVQRAIELGSVGQRVALVCGGDAGVYGLAGLVFEVLWEQDGALPVTVYPGVSAANAAAALLGAPLTGDYANISLSDQLVPLEEILARVEAAARTGFIICFYNPRATRRTAPFDAACAILARHRAPETPVGIVHAAFRQAQKIEIIRLADLSHAEVDMSSLVIIGNRDTMTRDGRLVTSRGYQQRYRLAGEARLAGHAPTSQARGRD